LVYFLFGWIKSTKEILPMGVHDWGQADRLAIAKCYAEDRSFWEPATYFQQIDDGRVGCEFPILQFIIGKTAKYTFGQSIIPHLYRWLVGLFWAVSLWFLFLFNKNILKVDELQSWLFALFWSCTPVLLHYGFGFLIDIPAYAMIVAMLYFLFLFHQNQSNYSAFRKALIFGLTAAMLKVSAFIFTGGILLVWFIWFLKDVKFRKKTFHTALVVSVGAGALLYYTYFHYIKFNSDNYISVFISWTTPLGSKDFFQVLGNSFYRWHLELFTIVHWIILIIGTLLVFVHLYRKRNKERLSANSSVLIAFFSIVLVLKIVFLTLYGIQFKDHDYYFIVVFMPLLVLYGSYIAKNLWLLSKNRSWKWMIYIALSFSIYVSLKQSLERRNNFYEKGKVWINSDLEWLLKFRKTGDIDNLPKNKSVAVLFENSFNVHLVHLNRKGIVFNQEEMSRDEPYFESISCEFKPDFFVLQKKYVELFEKYKSEWFSDLNIFYENEELLIYQTSKRFFQKHCTQFEVN